MRLAVIGSRNFAPLSDVRDFVHTLPRDTLIITGGASGVDMVAENAARELRLSRLVLEPFATSVSREAYRAALLERNKRIASTCERIVAFHDGVSTGTMHTVGIARSLGKDVEVRRGK